MFQAIINFLYSHIPEKFHHISQLLPLNKFSHLFLTHVDSPIDLFVKKDQLILITFASSCAGFIGELIWFESIRRPFSKSTDSIGLTSLDDCIFFVWSISIYDDTLV